MNYDAESNILSWELAKKTKITHTKEFGDFIIHLSKSNTPVLIEILNASNFKLDKIKNPTFKKTIREKAMAGISQIDASK